MPLLTDFTMAARYAKAYAESLMIATVKIERKGAPAFDSVTGAVSSGAPSPIYEGKARIWSVTGPMQLSFGDEPTYYSNTFATIPVATEPIPRIDDVLTVINHPGDPGIEGRVFQVKDVEAGGQFLPSRRLQLVGVQESKQWAES